MAQESNSQGFWQTLPGVITAIGGLLTTISALLLALNQVGIFKKTGADGKAGPVPRDTAVIGAPASQKLEPPAGAIKTVVQEPPSVKAPAKVKGHHGAGGKGTPAVQVAVVGGTPAIEGVEPPGGSGTYDPRAVLFALKAANIGTSVGEDAVLDWLNNADRTYRRIADASLKILGGKRMNGTAPDIDKIKYNYLELLHRNGGDLLPPGESVNVALLKEAILMASNEKNGVSLQRFELAVATR